MPDPSSTPTATPTGLSSSQSDAARGARGQAAFATLQQNSQLDALRAELLKANVPQATVDTVFKVVTLGLTPQNYNFYGYVDVLGTSVSLGSFVGIRQSGFQPGVTTLPPDGYVIFHFPPNDPKYWAEFARAQNYHLRLQVSYTWLYGAKEPTIDSIFTMAETTSYEQG